MYRDYIAAGIPAFPLWPIVGGACGCENEKCPAAGKHPRASAWQHTPLFSDEQIEFMEDSGQFDAGWGALVSKGLLVVDVDARSGGVKSWKKLCDEVGGLLLDAYHVTTGSGGGSLHAYYRLEGAPALRQSHPDYPGIDFKSSGYVVGPGSPHVNGGTYEIKAGDPSQIPPAPDALVEILRKPDNYRTKVDGRTVDLSVQDIEKMLSHVDPDCGYEKWIRCGMAVHEALREDGRDVWDRWSRKGKKYAGEQQIDIHWHSFGKSTNPVTIGTLAHYAKEGGWVAPVTFTPDPTIWIDPRPTNGVDLSDVDCLRPPGLVGEICAWINARSIYPREHLAVAAALFVVSAASIRYRDELDGITPNLIVFGVAGSGTGKEAIQKSAIELLMAAGIGGAIHGGFKSEQEIIRNLIEHQAAYYIVDEMGEVLSKLQTARAKGATPYLQGVIGQLMSIYTKADAVLPVVGDVSRNLARELSSTIKSLSKDLEEGDEESEELIRAREMIKSVRTGILEPYLCMMGMTTPGVFDTLLTYDMVANGFMGRAMVFRESDDNPRIKPRSKRRGAPGPARLGAAISQIFAPGRAGGSLEVRRYGDAQSIATTEDAEEMLDKAYDHFWHMAEEQSEETGYTALPRRGYELVAKVSLILAVPSGLRTTEHVRWAWALVQRDMDAKIRMVSSNSEAVGEAITARVLELIKDEGMTEGRLINRCRKWDRENVISALGNLVASGAVGLEKVPASRGGGRMTNKYSLT